MPSQEQTYYLWKCGKCGTAHPPELPFCPECAAAEGAENAEAAPQDKVGKITAAMMGAIDWSLEHGQIKPGEVLAQAGKRGLKAAALGELGRFQPAKLDHLAGIFLHTNRAGATGSGIATGLPGGLVGFAAIPADVAAVIYFSLRTASGVSQAYGFETTSQTGKAVQLLAFAFGSRLETLKIGTRRLDNLALAHYLLGQPRHAGLVKTVLLKQLAHFLALDFAKTSWATFLPVVGGVVNGTNNFFFLGDVSSRSKAFYRALLQAREGIEILNPDPASNGNGSFPLPIPRPLPEKPFELIIEERELKLPLTSGEVEARLVYRAEAVHSSLVIVLWPEIGGLQTAERLAGSGYGALQPLLPLAQGQLAEVLEYLTKAPPELEALNFKTPSVGAVAYAVGAEALLETLPLEPPVLSAAVIYNPAGKGREILTNVPVLLHFSEESGEAWLQNIRPRDFNGCVSSISYTKTSPDFADFGSPGYRPKEANSAWKETSEWLSR